MTFDESPSAFRVAAHRVVDEMADYLERLESHRVLPVLAPGDVRARLDAAPPDAPERLDDVLADVRDVIEPNLTHWQHPGFMAYFPSTAGTPGILGEMLAAAFNSNVMLWRNAPASTELEQVTVDWLRQMLGLPDEFRGMFTDTASISSLLSIAAARQAVGGWDWRQHGSNHAAAPILRLYRSKHAHSSIDKAALLLGLGKEGVREVDADRSFAMIPERLAAMIAEDRAAGRIPFCVVGTIGTTSSTAVDPIDAVASVCAREGAWLHVDAAYAGAAAILDEKRRLFSGWERADSIVFNLHKWFFTPFDASLLLFRDPERFRDAFSLVPEYLRTAVGGGAINFNEYGIQLGRRFRALKVWMMIRMLGASGLKELVRRHCDLAAELRGWMMDDADWEVVAPTPFATVCVRYVGGDGDAADLDRANERILEHVNAGGRFFLSHTVLDDRYVIRVVIGNPRQTRAHVRGCFEALKDAARRCVSETDRRAS